LLPYFDEFDFLLPNTPGRHLLTFATTPMRDCMASLRPRALSPELSQSILGVGQNALGTWQGKQYIRAFLPAPLFSHQLSLPFGQYTPTSAFNTKTSNAFWQWIIMRCLDTPTVYSHQVFGSLVFLYLFDHIANTPTGLDQV